MSKESQFNADVQDQLADAITLADEDSSDSGNGWLMTYGDMMTLLFCFFVLLFAMSETKMESFDQLVNSLKSAIGKQDVPEAGTREGLMMIDRENPLSIVEAVDELGGMVIKEMNDIVSEVDEFILKNSLKGQIKVAKDNRGAVITISDMLLFPSGQAEFNPEGESLLRQVTKLLKQFDYHIKIVGHTDSIPIFNQVYKSNWELSTARASEIVRFLIELGISPDQLSAEGFAEYRPAATNSTEEGRALNRRVEIVYERSRIQQKVLASNPKLGVLKKEIIFK